jgi:hypothetical protein
VGDNIYYQGFGDDELLISADAETFEVLEYGFAKDGNQAYYEGHPFKVIDVDSFESLDQWFAKDEVQVYEFRDYTDGEVVPRSYIDVETFESLGNNYAKDKDYVYVHRVSNNEVVKGMDAETFEVVNSPCYTKDSEHVYTYNIPEIVEGVDLNTFETFEYECYAVDKNHVYNRGKIVEKFDPDTFEILEGKIGNSCWFAVFNDKNVVYFFDEEIEGADPGSFELLDDKYFAKDKNYYYQSVKDEDLAVTGEPCAYSIEKVEEGTRPE